MTPNEIIAKWCRSELNERSASQERFIDLCRLLGEPTPTRRSTLRLRLPTAGVLISLPTTSSASCWSLTFTVGNVEHRREKYSPLPGPVRLVVQGRFRRRK